MTRGFPPPSQRRLRRGLPPRLASVVKTAVMLAALLGARPICAGAAAAEPPPCGEGEPFMQYFSPRDYHGGTQCLCATQDARGVMYIGSLGMVLEYDGSTWRKISVASNFVASIAYEPGTDIVYVGAENELGYLKSLPGGGRAFVSLLPRLPADSRDVGGVYGVHVTPEGVFFVSSRQVMRWRAGSFKTWKLPSANKLRSNWTGGFLYVCSEEVGLLRLENDTLATISNDPFLRQAAARSMLAAADGTLLIGTLNEGLLTLRDGVLRPADGECSVFLKEKGIYRMLRLQDGSLAIVTNTAGLLVVDPARRFRSHVDKAGGILGTNVFDLFEDAEGGLWVGLQSGVTRLEVNSPLSILRAGPDDNLSSAYASGHWFGTMVLGTEAGWYRVVPADPAAATGARLERLPDTQPFASGCGTVEDGLLTLTDGQIALLNADAKLIPAEGRITGVQSMCTSSVHPGVAYAVDNGGHISAFRLDGKTRQWAIAGIVADLRTKGGSFNLTESALGDLWVDTGEHGLFRVRLEPGAEAAVTSYLGRPGPLREVRSVQNCGVWGPLRFKSAHAICGLDDSGREPRPLTEFGPQFQDGSLNFGDAMSYEAGSLWFTATRANDPAGETLRGRATAGGEGRAPGFQPLPRKIEAAVGSAGVFHPMEVPPSPLKTLLLVGTTGNGVVQMNLPQWETQLLPRPYATLIQRAFTHNASSDAQPLPILGDPLPYARNSVHFEFAAATMAFGAAPRFQTRLANFGTDGWSDFSDRSSVDYLNLPEGKYTFEVRARNADGQLGRVASLPFRILPPWQRMPLAYALYALAAALGLYALLRWRGRQLRRRNVALERLVEARTSELRGREAELIANQQALTRARDGAEAANRAKSLFLANMSHELRTPLNAILGYSQILLKHAGLPARSREQVAVIGQSGSHLLSLINEVLDLSKVEAGKLTLSHVDFSLPQLLDEVGAAFRPRFAEKGLDFTEIRGPDLPAAVHADPSRLRQVLFNLLGNAVKFTPHGCVRLEVRRTDADGGWVQFEVADTGVGIEAEELRAVFLAFHQVGDRRLASQGTGLGLAISQKLVELLGGRIEVESTPGLGSRFWFELPLPAVAAASGGGAPANGFAAAEDDEGGPVVAYAGDARRVLLVDDVAENRRVLRDFLQPLGFEIAEAADGAECLAACEHSLPDAVLLDLRIGTPDGFMVARALRVQAAGAPLGIIAISASVFASDRQQAIDAGCDDFLPKPFEEAQMLGALGRALGLRWIRRPAEGAGTMTTPSPSTAAPADAPGKAPPLREEAGALLDLSLRGDIVGIRRRLEALQAAGVTDGTAALVRRLEPLVAGYQMDKIHAVLLEVQNHAAH